MSLLVFMVRTTADSIVRPYLYLPFVAAGRVSASLYDISEPEFVDDGLVVSG
jgi:hypothetical protein